MSDLSFTVEMHNPQQGHAELTQRGWPWAKSMLMAGHRIAVEFRPLEDSKTDEQRGYYHVILEFIAQHATADGKKYPMPVWKEFFRDKYLGFKVKSFVNPMTGRKVRRRVRVSTEDLGVRGYATLIDKVTAFASTDLNLTAPAPRRREHIDPDTGEIRHIADGVITEAA